MFRRILIANRGEIALRVLRACKELGIETVAIYSEADRNLLHLRYADETICIGPGAAAKSYLDIPTIISAAEIADVDAIHPGYGFLSENAHFAEVCQSCNIKFIGPSSEAIAMTGNKAVARELAREVGVPTVPGSEGVLRTEEEALTTARRIGYPVLIKAVSGGGGRGLRVASNDVSMVNGYHAARTEAEAAFKDPNVYLEKYVEKPRHVEIQILADTFGNVLHLGERDCSIQRRHQKLIEESPSPALTPELREAMGDAAVKFARAANYTSAGTVEFLLDAKGSFYFIEINARIQVEHPVTEMVTGLDLIKEQLRMVAGERIPMTQDQVTLRGHCIEFRINAEDPDKQFKPSPGLIPNLVVPGGPGVRWDSHIYPGYTVPPNYDSLLGKLIVWRSTRREALATARRALEEFHIEGIKTTIPLYLRLLEHSDFISGEVDTGFVERFFVPR